MPWARPAYLPSIDVDEFGRNVDNLLPSIHVRLGEGHTMGQQFVVIETSKGKPVISGDCIYARRNICGHNRDGVYVPLRTALAVSGSSSRLSIASTRRSAATSIV
jgi:glyoxylase-like metal-dependent hydrolase (beta-lactamase superfamily II)